MNQFKGALEALNEIGEENIATLASVPAKIEELFWEEFRVIRAALEQGALYKVMVDAAESEERVRKIVSKYGID